MDLAIIDYKMSNLHSVQAACATAGGRERTRPAAERVGRAGGGLWQPHRARAEAGAASRCAASESGHRIRDAVWPARFAHTAGGAGARRGGAAASVCIA